MSVTAWVVTVGTRESREGNILTIDCAVRIGRIGADVIERARDQAGDGAGEGAGAGRNSLLSLCR